MWLLSTDRAELRYFTSPEAVQQGYAILSHVWEKEGEQTFQDLQRIREECAKSGANPRDQVSIKIRRCCELAERFGFKWIWNDTCCIDKSSSAELSESINSMFRYYSRSQVCFAYLHDVKDDDRDTTRLVKSKWFYRGWTLQELIAPLYVFFLSSSWTIVASKADCASAIETEHGIPAAVLQLQARPSDYSIAQRMSWAARRETTRVEDQAYSLLGLFDINMPTLYGEGEKAFRRLQEEIMRQCPDTTLFAWGLSCPSDKDTLSSLQSEEGSLIRAGLFARAPRDFNKSGSITWSASPNQRITNEVRATKKANIASFTLTPHGVLASHLPMLTVRSSRGDILTFADLSWSGQTTDIASNSASRMPIWLILTETLPVNSTRAYRVGSMRAGNLHVRLLSTKELSPDYLTWWNTARSTLLHEVYLTSQPPSNVGTLVPIPLPPLVFGLSPPFRLYEATLKKLVNPVLEWHLDLPATRARNTQPPPSADGSDPPIVFLYRHRNVPMQKAENAHAFIAFGTCTKPWMRSGTAHHWAVAQWTPVLDSLPIAHDCSKHHIAQWPYPRLALDKWNHLRFTPCPTNPTKTMIVNIEEKRLQRTY